MAGAIVGSSVTAKGRCVIEPPLGTGTDFLGYRIEAEIGRGGMGVVYRAYDLRLKRTVALKFIAPGLAADERFRERFARETELAMALEHPNVVPIHDAGDIDGRLYMAMRLVDSDLRKLLRAEGGGLEPARAVAICAQVAGALDAAHARGLVHRDVKPSNVLLDVNEHVYLADFGLTRRLDEPVPAGTDDRSIGTPGYLAPEQLEGAPVDSRADVYALGCVLFECLTSTPPYQRATRLEVAWAHLEEEPPRVSSRRPELPEPVDAVVTQAMAKDPEQRYASCGALAAAAESALQLRRRAPFYRRTSVLLATALLVVMVAAGGVVAGVLAHRGGHKDPPPPPLVRGNMVARIDPKTNNVSTVIRVGHRPAAIAAGGQSVWVYNRGDSTISEIDARTNTVSKTTPVPGESVGCCGPFAGPVLAADSTGAWFINGTRNDRAVLTHLLAGGRGGRGLTLDITPTGVAVGNGYVWVVGRAAHGYQVLRIDPATGHVGPPIRFAAPIESIAVGTGYVWVVDSAHATLYRIDAQTARRDRKVALGHPPAARPEPLRGSIVTVGYTTKAGSQAWVDAFTLNVGDYPCGCQPGQGDTFTAFGSDWWDDWPTGTMYRQSYDTGPVHLIAVTANPPINGGPCLTSMAAGAGSTWVTAGPTLRYYYACKQ